MDYIDLHGHMTSRVTDDYEQMALTGCVAISEPAFWAGYDRYSSDVFADYFNHLTTFEPTRAAKYGIQHYCFLCINPKEADDREMSRRVLDIIPQYLDRPTVLGIGEIGLNRVTRNETDTFVDQVNLAVQFDKIIQIHTPHLEDKYKGTKVIVDRLLANSRVQPARVLIDHGEEQTMDMILSNGFWTALTLYPQTKVSIARAVDIIEMYGSDRICVSSACDWGASLPVAVPYFIMEMRRRGHPAELIKKVVYDNPRDFLAQSGKFKLASA